MQRVSHKRFLKFVVYFSVFLLCLPPSIVSKLRGLRDLGVPRADHRPDRRPELAQRLPHLPGPQHVLVAGVPRVWMGSCACTDELKTLEFRLHCIHDFVL